MAKNIMDNLKMVRGMEKVNKYGRIILYIKGIGLMIKQMEKVELSMQMVMYIKANLKTIKTHGHGAYYHTDGTSYTGEWF
jgi:hypothetical protein